MTETTEIAPLTNAERKDDVQFLLEAYRASSKRPVAVLEAEEVAAFRDGDEESRQRLFFKLLCFAVLAPSRPPEAVVRWIGSAARPGVVDDRSRSLRFHTVRTGSPGHAQRQQGQNHRLHPAGMHA